MDPYIDENEDILLDEKDEKDPTSKGVSYWWMVVTIALIVVLIILIVVAVILFLVWHSCEEKLQICLGEEPFISNDEYLIAQKAQKNLMEYSKKLEPLKHVKFCNACQTDPPCEDRCSRPLSQFRFGRFNRY